FFLLKTLQLFEERILFTDVQSEGLFNSKLRKIFSQAAENCLCLLFIDDIDSLPF
ncbi:hypothetical protein X975_15033, partial [Stegodyphus mimosarum]